MLGCSSSQKVSAMPPLFGSPARVARSCADIFAPRDLFGHAVAFSPRAPLSQKAPLFGSPNPPKASVRRSTSNYAPSSLFGRTVALCLAAPLSQKVSAMPPLFGNPSPPLKKGGMFGRFTIARMSSQHKQLCSVLPVRSDSRSALGCPSFPKSRAFWEPYSLFGSPARFALFFLFAFCLPRKPFTPRLILVMMSDFAKNTDFWRETHAQIKQFP